MTSRQKKLLFILAFPLICLGILIPFWPTAPSLPGAEMVMEHGTNFSTPKLVAKWLGEDLAPLFPPVMLTIATLLGIAASIFWEYAEGKVTTVSVKSLAPVVVSPIILLFTYSMLIDHPDAIIAILMAFQNGFFWQVVLGKRSPRTKANNVSAPQHAS